MSFAISVASFSVIFMLSYGLRKILRSCLPKGMYSYIAELLCTFQLVACVYENSIVFSGYNVLVYAVVLFVLICAYSLTFDASGNPAMIFELIITRKCSAVQGILKMCLQVIGGLLAYRYVMLVWKIFAPTELHSMQVEVLDLSCDSPMKVSILQGLFAEMLATCTARLIAGMKIGGRRFSRIVNALTIVLVTLSGMEWTGMMFNPALATALAYNCKDHSVYEHILVYWCGPFLGVLVSVLLFKYVIDEIIFDDDDDDEYGVKQHDFKQKLVINSENGKRPVKRISSG